MSYDETMFGTAPPFSFEETEGYEEKDLSASLTLRWSRKRRRWECDNAYFWHESQNKWCCRSEDGRYYHGFRSLRALLKSYVADACVKAPAAMVREMSGQNTGSASTPRR